MSVPASEALHPPAWGRGWGRRPAAPQLPRWPGAALTIAAGGLVVGLGLATVGAIAVAVVAPRHPLVRLLVIQAGLWCGLVGAPIVVSRRYGSGSLRQDFGLRSHPGDAPAGLVISIVGRMASTVVIIPLILTSKRLVGVNTHLVKSFSHDAGGLIAIVAVTVLGAPVVEELFFRGLILPCLRHRWSGPQAIAGQAVLFGVCHVRPGLGWANASVVLAITVFGAGQGIAATWFGRLGPNIWAHASFNAVVIVAILASQ